MLTHWVAGAFLALYVGAVQWRTWVLGKLGKAHSEDQAAAKSVLDALAQAEPVYCNCCKHHSLDITHVYNLCRVRLTAQGTAGNCGELNARHDCPHYKQKA